MTVDQPVVDQLDADDVVDALGAPTPTPWQDPAGADAPVDVDPGDPDAGPPPEPLSDDELAGILAVAVGAPFDWTGALLARGKPDPLADEIRGLWPLGDDQASRVGRRLVAAVPARWRESRVLAHSPALLALGELSAAFVARTRQTERLVRAYEAAAAAAGEPAAPGSPPPEETPDAVDPAFGSLRRRPVPRGAAANGAG